MSTGLRERLAALADEGLAGDRRAEDHGALPAHLWGRGRRRQVRRALAGTVLVAVISVLVGVGGATVWQRAGTIDPSTSLSARMQLPTRLYDPSPWIDGTEDAGTIGPLVAVIGPVERKSWWSTSHGLVGVSARSGEYRFLDLLDAVDLEAQAFDQDDVAALSPDGTMLAYWVAGPEQAAPCRSEDADRCAELSVQMATRHVAGVAVYDTVTGEVHRKDVASDHGLMPQGMAWSGDTLWVTYGTYDESGVKPESTATSFGGQLTWSAGTSAWEVETDPAETINTSPAANGSESFVTTATRRKGYVEVGPRGERRSFILDVPVTDTPFVSPSGNRVAAIQERANDSSGPLLVAELGNSADSPDSAQTRRVPGTAGSEVLGWRDEHHVVISQRRGLVSVNIDTGASELLMKPPQWNWSIAADAWSAPVVTPQPHQTVDPRIRALLITCGVAAVWTALSWWRRFRGRT